MEAVLNGSETDRFPFVPSIYEHGAAVIGRAPGETSRSARLTAEAALASWRLYGHDLVTVGIDIYNVEAEAFGCEISEPTGNHIPGVKSHPLGRTSLLDSSRLAVPKPGAGNRLQMLADATRRVVEAIGEQVWVYSTMAGPFSQAVELRGFEALIGDMLETAERVHGLLEKTTELALQQAARLSATGAGLSIFESWATLPLITPDIFAEYVVPYNKRVIAMIRSEYDVPPPALIMGGDTTKLMDLFVEAGAGLVAVDYLADLGRMMAKTRGHRMIIRGCADPKMIEREQWDEVEKSVAQLRKNRGDMRNFVWGCGAVSYDTRPEALLRLQELCLTADTNH